MGKLEKTSKWSESDDVSNLCTALSSLQLNGGDVEEVTQQAVLKFGWKTSNK